MKLSLMAPSHKQTPFCDQTKQGMLNSGWVANYSLLTQQKQIFAMIQICEVILE